MEVDSLISSSGWSSSAGSEDCEVNRQPDYERGC